MNIINKNEESESFYYKLKELPNVLSSILPKINSNFIFIYGKMGAGKTTMIKAFLKKLGIADPGDSPTFGLVNEYADASGDILAYHFDFYRIEEETEALDMGWEDYLNQDKWIFAEWPEKIPHLLPVPRTEIHLEIINQHSRKLTLLTIKA